jgi:hypothetical protein
MDLKVTFSLVSVDTFVIVILCYLKSLCRDEVVSGFVDISFSTLFFLLVSLESEEKLRKPMNRDLRVEVSWFSFQVDSLEIREPFDRLKNETEARKLQEGE